MGPVPATVCRPVDIFTFYDIAGSDVKATELFQTFGVLPKHFTCQDCGSHIPKFVYKNKMVLWRCSKHVCSAKICYLKQQMRGHDHVCMPCVHDIWKERSVRTDSKFLSHESNHSRLKLHQVAALIYSWTFNMTLPHANILTSLSVTAASKYFNLFRDVCFEALILHEQENGPDPFIQSLEAQPESVEPPFKVPKFAAFDDAADAEADGVAGDQDEGAGTSFDADAVGYSATRISSQNSNGVPETGGSGSPSWQAIASKYRQFARLDKRRIVNIAARRSIGNNMPRYVAEEWWRAHMSNRPGHPARALFEEFLKLVGRSKVYGCQSILQLNNVRDYDTDVTSNAAVQSE